MKNTMTDSPLDIVIFGGAGDLSFRKLLPALYMAYAHHKLGKETRIVAVGRQNWSHSEYLEFIRQRSPGLIDPGSFDADSWHAFL